VARPVWLAAQITARLQRRLGDRRIDVLVIDPVFRPPKSQAFTGPVAQGL
jgi:hypothetical protein